MENLKILKTEPSLVRPNPAANGSVDNVVNDPVIFGRGPNANMVNPYALPPPPALPARTNVGFTPEERARLEIDLPKYIAPEFTSTRSGPGQTTLNYIEGWRIKNLANKLFGFNGWNHSISDVTVDFLDVDRDGKVSVGVSVMVRVTLKDGTYHEDMGYGSSENQKSKASSFEKARKEAVTDALKRALTSFGNVLGTCLYDKNYCKYLRQQRFNPKPFDAKDFYYGEDERNQRPLQPQKQLQQTPQQNSIAQLPQPQQPHVQQQQRQQPPQQPSLRQNAHMGSSSSNGQAGGSSAHQRALLANTASNNNNNNNNSSSSSSSGPTIAAPNNDNDDELFGLDFDGGRPLQPESPRMSDFDDIDMGAMGEMMADDSPVKPKTNGAVGGIPNPFNTNNVPAPPATLKRQGTFSRSTSSPSLSSPTKSAGPPQAFQGQETALITNVKPTSLYSPAINPFIVRNPTPTASSFTANGSSPSTSSTSSSVTRTTPPPSKTSLPLPSTLSSRTGVSSNISSLRSTSVATSAQSGNNNGGSGATGLSLSTIHPSGGAAAYKSSTLSNHYNPGVAQSSGLKRPLGVTGVLDSHASTSNKEARLC